MIDTLRLILNEEDVIKLIPFCETVNEQTYNLQNLIIRKSRHSWTIQGSIPKYLDSSNHKTSSWNIVNRFLLKMKRLYSLDLRSAKVSRVDWGVVIPFNEVSSAVSNIIELNGRYEKRNYGNHTLIFHNKSAALTLYDKTLESKGKFTHHNGDHLLRIESRSLNGKSSRNRGIRTLNDLRVQSNQIKLENELISKIISTKWYKEYRINSLKNIKVLEGFLLQVCLKKFGEGNLFKVLEDHRLVGKISSSTKSELRKSILRKVSEADYREIHRKRKIIKQIKKELMIIGQSYQ